MLNFIKKMLNSFKKSKLKFKHYIKISILGLIVLRSYISNSYFIKASGNSFSRLIIIISFYISDLHFKLYLFLSDYFIVSHIFILMGIISCQFNLFNISID